MLSLVLAASLVAAPMPYQVKSFVNEFRTDAPPTGELTPGELSCVVDEVVASWPGESPVDVVGLVLARNNLDRSQVCLRWVMERTETVEAYATRETIPTYVRFADTNDVVFFHERLDPVCVPRGQAAALPLCLSRLIGTPGQVTLLDAHRQTTGEPMVLRVAYELVNREPSSYAADKRAGVALNHTTEIEPELPEEPAP